MNARDTIFDSEFTEKILDSEGTPEELEQFIRAFAEFYPCPRTTPQDIGDRTEYIAGQIHQQGAMILFTKYPGLPRFIAVVYDIIDALPAIAERAWIVANLNLIDVPDHLEGIWRKHAQPTGLGMMGSMTSGEMSIQAFPSPAG